MFFINGCYPYNFFIGECQGTVWSVGGQIKQDQDKQDTQDLHDKRILFVCALVVFNEYTLKW